MTFAHPHFAEPHWLWLAALAPVMVLLLHRYAAWGRRRQIALFAAPELIAGLMRSHSPVRRALKNLLLVFAMILLAAFDFWAIARFGIRHHRQIQEDRRAMLESHAARLRSQRNGRN